MGRIQPWDGAIFATAGLEQFAKFASQQEQQIPFTGCCAVDAGHIGHFALCFAGLSIASEDNDAVVDRHRPWTATAGGIGKLIQWTGHGTGFLKRRQATVERCRDQRLGVLCVADASLAISFLQTGGGGQRVMGDG